MLLPVVREALSIGLVVLLVAHAGEGVAHADDDAGADAALAVDAAAGEVDAGEIDAGDDGGACSPDDEVGPCRESETLEECVTSTGMSGACVASACLGKLVCRPGVAANSGCCSSAAQGATPAAVSPSPRLPRRASFGALAALAFFLWHRRRR